MASIRLFVSTLLTVLTIACQGMAADELAKNSPLILHLPPDAIILQNPYFYTVYSTRENIVYYSEYVLTAAHLAMPKVGRSNQFHADPELTAKGLLAVQPTWYQGSGYDRGHLAPSGDFNWDTTANYATFTMSNMTPQRPNLNRVAWATLESEVRLWTCAEGEVEIATGPIPEPNLPPFNGHPIPTPNRFFKAIVRLQPPEKAIAFVMSQTDSTRTDYQSRVATLAEVEQLTGLILYENELAPNDPVRTHSDISEWHQGNCTNELAPPPGDVSAVAH